MKEIKYKIEFLSEWHIGSGLDSGADADSIVLKDENNLPYIPGKTLKGLLREAAEVINYYDSSLVTQSFIDDVFGEKPDEDKNGKPKAAKSFFSDAFLTDQVKKYFLTNPGKKQKQFLFMNLASTKIDDAGQAEDHSLRNMEVTIPLTLYAEIIDFPEKYKSQVEYCLKYVKKLGLNRNRGLGRCKFSII